MAVHPLDFQLNKNVYSTPELKHIFEEETVFQRWLDFEAALAEVQGELGVIPHDAAREIKRAAHIDNLDKALIKAGYEKSRNSLIPLLNALKAACKADAGQYVHYGPTTQDVIDTGQVLGIRQVVSRLYRDLREIEQYCLVLAERHFNTPMVGRTHGQQALPITFGMKVAGWMKEVRAQIQRMKYLFRQLRFGQFAGAVGTLAALGSKAGEIARHTLERLGLEYDAITWHTRRDSISEMTAFFSMTAATMSRIANEIYLLQKTEIGELTEPPPPGQLASSTMPHKQNPVLCQRVTVLFRHVNCLVPAVFEGMCHEHERDPRCLWTEWLAVPQVCVYTGTAVHYVKVILSALNVHVRQMKRNLMLKRDFMAAEWMLFKLADSLGKMDALDKMKELTSAAESENVPLKNIILARPEISRLFAKEDLAVLDSPELYTGQAENIVRQAIMEVKDARSREATTLA